MHVMSLKLCRVLRDIGVTRHMVIRRRTASSVEEKLKGVAEQMKGTNLSNYYVFGSQSEGTTTNGMNSDKDILFCDDLFSVIKDWEDWEPGKICLLIVKNECSPPQHGSLQMLRTDCPLPMTPELMPAGIDLKETMDGRVLLKNTRMDSFLKKILGAFYRQQGPSRSFSKSFDFIVAFRYKRLLFECNFLFTRPKPGHWPRPEILIKACQCETFFVPQGHPESDQSILEWRAGTPTIERLLMFDLNILQIQVYTFLKILRMSFFKPLVGDRLSTFHFKTALFFTLETHPPEIWQERYLLQCVIYCLKTLQRWFKLRLCPHYTISGVDLFVGKLRKWEFPRLLTVLSDIMDNMMDFVSLIEIDQIGERISGGLSAVSSRYTNFLGTVEICLRFNMFGIISIYYQMTKHMQDVSKIQNYFIRFQDILRESDIRVEIQHAERFLYQYIATMLASTCLQRHQLIPQVIYRLYEASMDSDLTSSRLKLASMMYCSGQYEMAEFVLSYTERLLHPDVLQWCPCGGRGRHAPTEGLLHKAYKLPFLELIKRHVAYSVIFNSFEKCCLPEFLVYEMNRRTWTDFFYHSHPIVDTWMNLAIIDSIPFLYYMQYLTYRQLGEQERKQEALVKLRGYVFGEIIDYGHIDTALNVLGHCYELENRYYLALGCYRESLNLYPHNNAARWHIMRLQGQA